MTTCWQIHSSHHITSLFLHARKHAHTHTHTHTHTHKHMKKTHPHVHTQSPSISFRRVPSALQREYPTALEKRFNSEMRESSGKCTGHIKALMLPHESKQACWVHRQRLVSCASSEAKSCELLGKMVVCLLNLYTGLRKKKQKNNNNNIKNHYISKQMTCMIKSSETTHTHTHIHMSLL